jgi:hypothetical protein
MVTELRRIAGMLGWLEEIDAIITLHTVETTDDAIREELKQLTPKNPKAKKAA